MLEKKLFNLLVLFVWLFQIHTSIDLENLVLSMTMQYCSFSLKILL